MQVYFTNLGCKLNQAEVDAMARRFVAAGHALAPSLERADLHVVNSCTVTHKAARDSRKVARRGARVRGREDSPVRTVLTGCYATDSPEEAAALAGVDLVVTNDDKDRLLERVHAAFPDAVPPALSLPVPYVPIDFGLARALVKVEDGCNMRCAFCIIPSTRGRQRSRPVAEVVAEVAALARGGYPEIVVTGVQISEYDDRGANEETAEPRRLYDLVRALLDRLDRLDRLDGPGPRLRLSSIAPWRFDDRLLTLWHDPRLCRHLHLSLQSGADATLKRMRRPYTAAKYAALIERIRAAIPGVAITTDVIVGFPGESDEEFAESLAFVERMAFARTHVFAYSPRAGTEAATLPDPVPPPMQKARMTAMLEVAAAGERAFRAAQLGARLGVVWESRKNGSWCGLSDNYVRVLAARDQDPERPRDRVGTLGEVIVERLADSPAAAAVIGRPIGSP